MASAVNKRVRRAGAAGRNVRGGIAVSLKFVVAEAAAAGIESPVRAINRTIQRAVEFVALLRCPADCAGHRCCSARSADSRCGGEQQ